MRQDVVALTAGLAFIIALLGGIWGWGIAKDWSANSGYDHYSSNTSQERFLPEPVGCNDTSIPGRSGAGCTGTWYYWKLPPSDVTATTRAVVWLCYCLHQIFIWGLIYRAQLITSSQSKEEKYSTNLRWFNFSMLFVNALFHILHLVQTHTTYDATAQDVTISSSQSSVIMMICFILLMEYKNRGLILMWPNPESEGKVANALRLHPGPVELIRKYHGFAFSWASIYTFWYHPMENTWGHALGFFHTAIVMLQGSLVFTEIHLNKYWKLLNECWVLIHATVIAVQTGNPAQGKSDLWPLFTFGFGFVFAFTQIYSFPFWKKIPSWIRVIPPILYLIIVCVLCATLVVPKDPSQSGFSQMYVMVFIPAQEYIQAILSWFFLYVFVVIESKFNSPNLPSEEKGTPDKSADPINPSATKQACYLCGVILIYAMFVLLSYFIEQAHYKLNMTVMMMILVLVFSTGVCVTIMFFKQLLGPHRSLVRPKTSKINVSENGNEIPVDELGSTNKTFRSDEM